MKEKKERECVAATATSEKEPEAVETASANEENGNSADDGAPAEPPAEEKPQEEKRTVSAEELEAAVAEAERRGYLRGRNERIEELMAPADGEEERVEILQHRRVSIWDL